MRDKIWVVGGYGQVGRVICEFLSKKLPGKVVAAGRNKKMAEDYALSTEGKVLAEQLDIYKMDEEDMRLDDVKIVVMCIDQKNTQFVNLCIEKKIHYVDISPSYNILSQIETLRNKAAQNDVSMMLGVGLCPGLTNLLAKKSLSEIDFVHSIDIYLMLGVGEKHGKDGVEWLLNSMKTDFTVIENNQEKKVKSFRDKKRTQISPRDGVKTAYRFNLADQHILPQTLGIKTVSTRFCYDLKLITGLVAFYSLRGFFKLMKFETMKSLMVIIFSGILTLFKQLNIGSDAYAIKVEAQGIKNGQMANYEASLYGNNNTRLTAHVAATVAEKMYVEGSPPGVWYIEQAYTLEQMLEDMDPSINVKLDIRT